jgi:hypothetical protein
MMASAAALVPLLLVEREDAPRQRDALVVARTA